jgi:streptogramin lyase
MKVRGKINVKLAAWTDRLHLAEVFDEALGQDRGPFHGGPGYTLHVGRRLHGRIGPVDRTWFAAVVVVLVLGSCMSRVTVGVSPSTTSLSLTPSYKPTPQATVLSTTTVPSGSSLITSGFGALWVIGAPGVSVTPSTVSRIDPTSHKVVATIQVGGSPSAIATGAGKVWVADRTADTVTSIDPASGQIDTRVGVCAAPAGLAVTSTDVWVACSGDGMLGRIALSASKIVATIPVGHQPTWVTLGFGSVWTSDPLTASVIRVDPSTNNVVARVPVGSGAGPLSVVGGSLWMSDPQAASADRIDPRSNLVATSVKLPVAPGDLAPAAASLWIAGNIGPVVMRIDPTARSFSGIFTVADAGSVGLQQMSIASSSMWFPIASRGQVLQVGIPT